MIVSLLHFWNIDVHFGTVHIIQFEDGYAGVDAHREQLHSSNEWHNFRNKCVPLIQSRDLSLAQEFAFLPTRQPTQDLGGIFEFRQYQLVRLRHHLSTMRILNGLLRLHRNQARCSNGRPSGEEASRLAGSTVSRTEKTVRNWIRIANLFLLLNL